MCGITGFIDFSLSQNNQDLQALAARMADTLSHRGPDDGDTWTDAKAGVALGFRRLAIIDLSNEGRQPMRSANGRYVIVFNGEVYNFAALRAELEALGHAFRGRSDTEVMLAAISQWGLESALRRFNGMFAFALWDRANHRLYLARDRLGIKPLYYGWMGHVFLFGSELKPLRAHPAFRAQIDLSALALYLHYSYIPTPHSIYKGIYKLPPGTWLAADIGSGTAPSPQPTPTVYWSARDAAEKGVANPFAGTEDEAVAAMDALLRDSVRMRMVADVPLGTFLSGGIDSSTIAALMQAQSTRPVQTFTIGNFDNAYDEAKDAKRVAEHLGTEHVELYISPAEALAVIPRLPTLYDEPFADISQIPTFLVSEMARRHVTVSLSGDGGDEVFGGYLRYLWVPDIWRKVGWMPGPIRRLIATALKTLSPRAWDKLFKGIAPVLPQRFSQRTPGDRLHKLADALVTPDPEAMYRRLISFWQTPLPLVGNNTAPPLDVARNKLPHSLDFTQHMMYQDTINYLPNDILVKLDRASMGVSLEGRVPLLDHRVVELAWQMPQPLKIRDTQSKWLLRKVLYQYVPSTLIERPKFGFAVPIDAWLRGSLREWSRGLLAPDRLRQEGFLNPAPVHEKLQQHLSGRHNWQYYLWNVLMFQAWLETYM